MSSDSFEQILDDLEDYAGIHGLTRAAVADALGVSRSTLHYWFAKGPTQGRPSQASIRKIKTFLRREHEKAHERSARWNQICAWWRNQHRYASVGALAEDIGWDEVGLALCLEEGLEPPQLVVEAVLQRACIGATPDGNNVELVHRSADKAKHLLILLEDELRVFRDGTKPARDVFREELDPDDVGYISSLLNMLGDEAKFARWVRLTTNRFNFFRRKHKR